MFFPIHFLVSLLARLANTAPITEDPTSLNFTKSSLHHHTPTTATTATTLTKAPSYCSFPANEFYYLPFTYHTRPACIGIDTFNESPTPWSPTEYANIYAAMAQQVTKDGLFKTSQVGCWVANFEKFTSAIKDREGYREAFWLAVENGRGLKEVGFQRFYFQLDGAYTVVGRLAIC